MSRPKTYVGILGTWQRLLAPLQDLPPGLEFLVTLRDKLATMLGRAVDVTMQQHGMAADKQQLSVELRQIVNDGERLATALRVTIKEHYGPRAEKLTAFGIQPFRGRKPLPAPVPEPGPDPGPGPIEIAAPPQDGNSDH